MIILFTYNFYPMIEKSVLEKSHSNLRACVSRKRKERGPKPAVSGECREKAVWGVPAHLLLC